jgi:polar amino acid transport system ATP-binding protein
MADLPSSSDDRSNPAPQIVLRNIVKRYGPLTVLQGIDLRIERGTKVAVIGPSGSGKSTLLRLLMTLERPDEGRIELDGEPMWTMQWGGREVAADETHLRRVRQKIGMVFQHFNLFPHLTALDNVALAPRLVGGTARRDANQQARDLLGRVGLEEKADVFPARLSGGQKQRVAIARALAMSPEIMLFDEVTSALDPELVGEVLAVLRQLARESDMTMLLVTHEMRFAREIADRVLFFESGQVLEDGPPSEIFQQPAHQRTREFLESVLAGD